MSISSDSSFPNDGICIDYLSLNFDELDYNDVLISEETWLDGNCNAEDKTCPCNGYPVSEVEYKCQVWQGTSQVSMSVGQFAWITDIPVGVVEVEVVLDANGAYDLYAILAPSDYETGDGFSYDFSTVSGVTYHHNCIVKFFQRCFSLMMWNIKNHNCNWNFFIWGFEKISLSSHYYSKKVNMLLVFF